MAQPVFHPSLVDEASDDLSLHAISWIVMRGLVLLSTLPSLKSPECATFTLSHLHQA
jgi:hypothetical protein